MKKKNNKRANRCGKVLGRYGTNTNDEVCLTDFLADTRHWCDRKVYHHYLAELAAGCGGSNASSL